MPDYYDQLRAKADGFFHATRARHPASFACREGCSGCCHRRLSLFPVEADRLEAAVAALPEATRQRLERHLQDPPDHCVLLLDGRCAAYEDRPLICRTHGAPVRVDGRTDVCPLNFVDEPIPEPSVLDLEKLNEILVAVNVHHCRRQGTDPAARRSIVRILGSGLRAPRPLRDAHPSLEDS